MPQIFPQVSMIYFRTTAIAVVLLFFASCSADDSLVKPGAGAALSSQQQEAANNIDALIGQELGETNGLCKEGYANYSKCFKQEIYRLLTKYYNTTITSLAGGTIAAPATPSSYQGVFEIDIPDLANNDIIYLVSDFAIYAPASQGLLFTLELIHIDNDAANTITVLAKASSSLSEKMHYKRSSLSGLYTSSGTTRPGRFALRLQTSLPAGSSWSQGNLVLDRSSQLSALHYKAFTVDDIFGQDSKANGYYQAAGYSHFTLANDLLPQLGANTAEHKNTIVGPGKAILSPLNIKDLEKGDILVLRFSGAFDYFDSLTGCSDVPSIDFSFASISGSTLTPMGKPIPALLSNTLDALRRESDVQFVHATHIVDILEDQADLNIIVKLDQKGSIPTSSADCKITFRNDANATALTYELYRPISKLEKNFYLGKFLADVSTVRDETPRSTVALNFSNNAIVAESFAATGSVPLKQNDMVFADGDLNLDTGVLGIASNQIEAEISLSELLLGNKSLSSHVIRQSLKGRHASDHLYVHRALDIFKSVPEGEILPGRFQLRGKFISGAGNTPSPTDQVDIKVLDSSLNARIFRSFDSIDKTK